MYYNSLIKNTNIKMRKAVLVFVFVIALVRADEESSSSEESLKEYANYLDSKFNTTISTDIDNWTASVRKACPNFEQLYEDTVQEIFSCFGNIEIGSLTLCSVIKRDFVKCTGPATRAVTACLPEDAKFLPNLKAKIIKAVIDQLCNSTVEEVIELANPCLYNDEESGSLESCDAIGSLAEYKNKLPTKTFICKFIPKIRQCVKIQLDESCTNPITKAVPLKFFDAIERAIADDCKEENEVLKN